MAIIFSSCNFMLKFASFVQYQYNSEIATVCNNKCFVKLRGA